MIGQVCPIFDIRRPLGWGSAVVCSDLVQLRSVVSDRAADFVLFK